MEDVQRWSCHWAIILKKGKQVGVEVGAFKESTQAQKSFW